MVVNLEAKELIVLDSMHGTDTSAWNLLNSFIANEYEQQGRHLEYKVNEWKTLTPKEVSQPKQQNCNDCGAFSLLQAIHVASSRSGRSAIIPLGKDEANMLWFRKRVVIEVRKRAGIILHIHTFHVKKQSLTNPRV
jgi:Ulp1 family protease